MEGALASMLEFARKHGCELVFCDHVKVYESGHEERCSYALHDMLPSPQTAERLRHDVLRPSSTVGSACIKLYRLPDRKRDLPRFNESLSVGEDTEFVFRFVHCVERIGYMHKPCYLYMRNEASAVRAFRSDYELRIRESMDAMKKSVSALGSSCCYNDDFQVYVLFHLLLILVHYIGNPGAPWNMKERKAKYDEVLALPLYCEALKFWKTEDFSLTRNAALFSMRHKLYPMSLAIAKVRQRQFRGMRGAQS